MTYDELFELIKLKFDLVDRPSNQELRSITDELLKLSETKEVDDSDLLYILNKQLNNPLLYCTESLDMTASINLAKQILVKLKNSKRG